MVKNTGLRVTPPRDWEQEQLCATPVGCFQGCEFPSTSDLPASGRDFGVGLGWSGDILRFRGRDRQWKPVRAPPKV